MSSGHLCKVASLNADKDALNASVRVEGSIRKLKHKPLLRIHHNHFQRGEREMTGVEARHVDKPTVARSSQHILHHLPIPACERNMHRGDIACEKSPPHRAAGA